MFNSNTKYIFNKGTGVLHYYNTKSCYSSRVFSTSDKNLKFYSLEDDVYKDNKSHFRKCKKCFRNI